ncbi:TadE/TadG family type IV pilus assembly protein [Aureimonas psammosilenae]|uniref:TadE/TadG family type IV pilus assembly protein n=1 Tax=Aureimonas psammosilenae TaxID=2495496 RepID=UPI001260EF1D|nr:TadE/TadG family type IV pilus assembly protein [Aureimonas psammosilenae]
MLTERRASRSIGEAKRFLADRRGIAALEFVLIAPIMILLLGSLPDVVGVVSAAKQATKLAETMGQLVSQAKVTLTENDINQILNAAPLVDPDILSYARAADVAVENAASITITSVAFTPIGNSCATTCQYEAGVVFSRTLSGTVRECGKLSAGSTNSPTTLPAEVFSANSIVVVDVETHFKPFATSFLTGEVSFKRSSYFRPRYLENVTSTKNCPGYAS